MKVTAVSTSEPIEAALLDCLKEVEADFHTHGWDQPHAIGLVYRENVDLNDMPEEMRVEIPDELVPVLPEALGFLYEIRVLHVFSRQQMEMRLPMLISLFADSLKEHKEKLQIAAPDKLQAWFVIFESWAVWSDGELSPEEVDAVAHRRELHKHPKRVSTRQVLAVDITGGVYMVSRTEGQEDVVTIAPSSEGDEISGGVVTAMKELMQASL